MKKIIVQKLRLAPKQPRPPTHSGSVTFCQIVQISTAILKYTNNILEFSIEIIMEIFDEFIIVDEKVISELFGPTAGTFSFNEKNRFATFKFTIMPTTYGYAFQIADIGNASSSNPSPNSEPLAQIVRWNWDQNGAPKIIEAKTLNKGSEINFAIIDAASSIVIRILKKREMKVDEKSAFPVPSISSSDDDLTVKIGDKQVAVSAHWLMSVSPVISRMLSVEMKEKQQRMITLNELGVDMDQFMEFLEAIFYMTKIGPFLPNPKNVLALLKLADYFKVTALKSRCETHLINCVEIPLIDRFLLIDRYGLDNLKNFFLDDEKLHAFFKANSEKLRPAISKESLCALSV